MCLPQNTHWRGRACTPSAAIGDAVPPPVVQPGSVRPSMEPPRLPGPTAQACPPERPDGLAPNCCPRYTFFSGGVCVRTSQTSRSDSDKVQVRSLSAKSTHRHATRLLPSRHDVQR